jgi:hypothetical protein
MARAESSDVVEFTTSIYRGDRYRIVSELGPGGAPVVPSALVPRSLTAYAE